MSDVKVSIFCITYNQADYIESAIIGFLNQKTDFNFEVLIHDDASSDGTADIIRDYERKFPNIIKAVFQKENQYSQGREIISSFLLPFARGEYCALCEGDDYWIKNNKLQKQYDFMESHLDFSMCGHAVFQSRASDGLCFGVAGLGDADIDLTARDLFNASDTFIPTCSLFRRMEVFRESVATDFRSGCPVGDYPARVFAGLKGKVHFDSEVMAVKRESSKGSFSTRIVRNYEKSIECYKGIVEWLNGLLVAEEFVDYKAEIAQEIERLELLILSKQESIAFRGKSALAILNPRRMAAILGLERSTRREVVKSALLDSKTPLFRRIAEERLSRRFAEKSVNIKTDIKKTKESEAAIALLADLYG